MVAAIRFLFALAAAAYCLLIVGVLADALFGSPFGTVAVAVVIAAAVVIAWLHLRRSSCP